MRCSALCIQCARGRGHTQVSSTAPIKNLVGKNVSHGYPNVFHLHGMVEELFALTLQRVLPVSLLPVVDPGSLQVLRRAVLDELGTFRRTKIPHGLFMKENAIETANFMKIKVNAISHSDGKNCEECNCPMRNFPHWPGHPDARSGT